METYNFLEHTINKKDILDLLKIDKGDLVFISGSLVEGTGNNRSDLDIFVIQKDPDPNLEIDYAFENAKVNFGKIGKLNCDIEYWLFDDVNYIFSQLQKIDFENNNVRTSNRLELRGVSFTYLTSFIHRILVGECIKNEREFDLLMKDCAKEKYYKLMRLFWINSIDNKYEDIMGNFEIGEIKTAIILAKQALLESLAIIVFSNNTSVDRNKWNYIKCRMISEKDIQVKNLLNKFDMLYFDYNKVKDDINLLENILLLIEEIMEYGRKKEEYV